MRAVRFSVFGGPEVLEVAEVDEPHAATGQVRIAVRAAGINGMDWKVRSGALSGQLTTRFPAGTGFDASGIVDEVGEGVTDAAIGDAVFGSGSATLAEHAVLKRWVRKPDALSFEEAAGYPTPVETALRILDQVGVQPGQTLLVSGAAGGVGSAVLQFARDRGIDVIGTASERNQEYLRSLGATAIVYGDGMVDRVRAVAPAGVDAALDLAGSGIIGELITLTGAASKVLSIADFSAAELGAKVSSRPVEPVRAYAEAARLFEAGGLRIPVARVFPLEDAAQAHAASAAGHVAGRFVVSVS